MNNKSSKDGIPHNDSKDGIPHNDSKDGTASIPHNDSSFPCVEDFTTNQDAPINDAYINDAYINDAYLNKITEGDEKTLYCDGLNEALIGIDVNTSRAVYSVERIIDILVDRDEMEVSDAWEYFDFNIAGAYAGAMTPIYMSEHAIDVPDSASLVQ